MTKTIKMFGKINERTANFEKVMQARFFLEFKEHIGKMQRTILPSHYSSSSHRSRNGLHEYHNQHALKLDDIGFRMGFFIHNTHTALSPLRHKRLICRNSPPRIALNITPLGKFIIPLGDEGIFSCVKGGATGQLRSQKAVY